VKLEGWSGGNGLVGLVGGKWLKPPTDRGSPIYLHDYFGPGRHAKVVSRHAPDLMGDGNDYREVATLTGEESRAAEVSDVEFPTLLHPVDDRPPATVITRVVVEEGKVRVYGTTSDDGSVKRVIVNGRDAAADAANFAQWNVVLEGIDASRKEISAHAEDEAGNVEKLPHVWAN
jgi:hypothetical protein